jgi:hypothetical protein
MLTRHLVAILVVLGLTVDPVRAQESAAAELLRRVPDDFGVCLVINDLRGHTGLLRKTPALAKLKANPLVQGLLSGKEVRDILRFEEELKKHLQFDLAFLRDEILGDAVVFAYQPAPPGQGGEKGMLLVKARSAEALNEVISKINRVQPDVALEERKHKEQTYYRRVHQQTTHYYLLQGPLLAVANREETIHALIERGPDAASARRDLWIKSGLSKAVATLILNPRIFDAELASQAAAKTGPEAVLANTVLKFWKGLDGVLVGLQAGENLELSLTLAARPGTDAAKLWAAPAAAPSDLWRRFPENALISATGQVDFAALLKQLITLLPEKDARQLELLVQKNVGAATGLDVAGQILPNIGPDVGFTVSLPEGQSVPRGLFALAAKPAPKEAPVDQMLIKSAQLFVGLAVFDHNRKSEHQIRIRAEQQGDVEVKYLANDKVFPAGVQPAMALKDGYLLFASAPEAIAKFGLGAPPVLPEGETPLVKIAPREWSRLMKMHRQAMIDHLVQKNNDPPVGAANVVDGVAAGLDVFQSLTLSQRVGGGKAAWIIRLAPTKN